MFIKRPKHWVLGIAMALAIAYLMSVAAAEHDNPDDSLTSSASHSEGSVAGRLAGCRVGGAEQGRPPDADQREGRVRLACHVTPGTVFARSDRLLVKTRRAR